MVANPIAINENYTEKYGFNDESSYADKADRGLSPQVVRDISERKNEPAWMTEFRLKSLDYYNARPMPTWGSDLSGIDFENIYYYLKPSSGSARSWDDVPEAIKQTFDKLGIPEAETSISPASRRSTSRKSSTTRSARTSRRRVSSSPTPTPRCASTRTSSRSTGRPLSPRTTTSSRR